MKLSGRTAIVTGASRGIGKAIALAFAREGANVVVTARSTHAIAQVAAEIGAVGQKALPVTADLLSDADTRHVVDEAVRTYGSVDILVNNAAIIHPPINLVDMDRDVWRQVLDVNLSAPAMLAQLVLPGMTEKGYGKIINISSIGGRRGGRGRSAYRVSKAGLISLTESLAAEVKEYGIDVNGICPGGTDTEGYRAAFKGRSSRSPVPLMRPEEIAEVALFLASDDSSAITGTSIDAFGASNPAFRW